MPYIRMSHALAQRIKNLRVAARQCARAGQATLADAFTGAAEALRRGDDVNAHLWLEKVDAARCAGRAIA